MAEREGKVKKPRAQPYQDHRCHGELQLDRGGLSHLIHWGARCGCAGATVVAQGSLGLFLNILPDRMRKKYFRPAHAMGNSVLMAMMRNRFVSLLGRLLMMLEPVRDSGCMSLVFLVVRLLAPLALISALISMAWNMR